MEGFANRWTLESWSLGVLEFARIGLYCTGIELKVESLLSRLQVLLPVNQCHG